MSKKPSILDRLDGLAMAIATMVSIGTVSFMFVTIAPEPWSKTVLGALGVTIVLFSVRALVKNKRGLWWLTAILIVYSDVSLLLALTEAQSKRVTEVHDDPVQKALHQNTVDAQNNLTEIIRQQGQAQKRSTLDNLSGQIGLMTDLLTAAQKAENAYHPADLGANVDASRVFMAIPSALSSGKLDRYLTFSLGLLASLILLLTVVAATKSTVRQVRSGERGPTTKTKRRRRVVAKQPE